MIKNGVSLISEGANMPSTPDAQNLFVEAGILYGPAKAANAGGVAVSALEMSQNAAFEEWTREEVDAKLAHIMTGIHKQCSDAAAE